MDSQSSSASTSDRTSAALLPPSVIVSSVNTASHYKNFAIHERLGSREMGHLSYAYQLHLHSWMKQNLIKVSRILSPE